MGTMARSTGLAFLLFTAYFVAGSLVSDSMRFPYGYVSAGAVVLFMITGLLLVRRATVGRSALITGLAALLSTLAAWLVLYFVSPIRQADPRPVADAIGEVVLLMTLAGWLGGAIGAGIGGRVFRRNGQERNSLTNPA
jgi:Na+/citrate or Na+/malate symporter